MEAWPPATACAFSGGQLDEYPGDGSFDSYNISKLSKQEPFTYFTFVIIANAFDQLELQGMCCKKDEILLSRHQTLRKLR